MLLDPKRRTRWRRRRRSAATSSTFYHGAEAATAAQEGWERRFSRKEDPTDIPEVDVPAASLVEGRMAAAKLLVAVGLAAWARRSLPPGSGAPFSARRGWRAARPRRAHLPWPGSRSRTAPAIRLRPGRCRRLSSWRNRSSATAPSRPAPATVWSQSSELAERKLDVDHRQRLSARCFSAQLDSNSQFGLCK